MSEPESHSDRLKRHLRARPLFLVAGVLAVVAATWLLFRPNPEELERIVTVDAAGDTVVYSGPVRDAVARARIVEAFNSVVAPAEDSAPDTPDADADSAKRAGSSARAARAARQVAVDSLARLYTNPVDPVAVVRALNLAVIDFAEGTAELPPDAAGFIQAAAEVIDRTPEGASFLVAGYARGGADAAADLVLSQRRADVVVNALSAAGADSGRLRAEGYGSELPGSEEGVAGDVDAAADREIVFRLIEAADDADEDAEAVETEGPTGADDELEAGEAEDDDGEAAEDAGEPEGDASPPGDQPEPASSEDGPA